MLAVLGRLNIATEPASWRDLETCFKYSPQELRRALRDLVADGYVETRGINDACVLYAINDRGREELRRRREAVPS
ncbi:MAG: hypothetical protein AAFQ71_15680 [Planctomycetota bacterium]